MSEQVLAHHLGDISHPENIDRFERFTELAGLQVADPEARIDAIRGTSADQFLDLLSVSNGLLRGEEKFQRWGGESAKVRVSSAVLGVALEPPERSHEMFQGFYKKFSDELEPSERGMQKSAVEMYCAIIGAHLFDDGNGRLARGAYYLVRYGELPEDQGKILERTSKIVNAAERLNQGAVKVLFDQEGLEEGEDYVYLNDLAADDMQSEDDPLFVDGGLTQQTKYLAARRVLKANNQWPDPAPKLLKTKDWPDALKQQFDEEYEQIREAWLAAYIDVSGKFAPWIAKQIEASE